MPGKVFSNRIFSAVRRFAKADQGNIAVMFAFAALPILASVGAAIDYSRVNKARTSLQAALDSAALMVSKDLTSGTISESDIDAKAKAYFGALYTDKTGTVSPSDIHATYTPKDSSGISTILITGSGSMQTDFVKVAGFPTLKYGSSSTAAWGNTRMRVAMVLDNTGSMSQNGKMGAMQTAAKDMIDTLSSYNKQTGDVYISIVPFTKDVNVGTTNVDASWINWTEWEAQPPILVNNSTWAASTAKAGSTCPFTSNSHGFTCMDRPATLPNASPATNNKIPSTGTYTSAPALMAATKSPAKPISTTTGATRPSLARPQAAEQTPAARAQGPARARYATFGAATALRRRRRRPPPTAPGRAASTIATRTTTPRTMHRDQATQARPRSSTRSSGRTVFRPPCFR